MRAVIVDDNEIDRLNLRTLLQDHEQIALAGEAGTVEDAVELIRRERPGLVFLDIHLGRQKGFKVLDGIGYKPQVVITTAHPHYALKGFEIDAVDYLLKPVVEEALARAVQRLFPDAEPRQPGAAVRLHPDDVQLFKESGTLYVVPVSHILAVTGERIYTRVLVKDGRDFLHNRPLREWRELLPERQFKTLDRSTIINLGEVKTVATEAGRQGSEVLFRSGGRPVFIGEAAVKALRSFL